LRIGFRITGAPYAFIQLGIARRDSGDESDSKAIELLRVVQEHYVLVHIPSARDAGSYQFQNRFRELLKNKLAERALHSGRQSGATTEYRTITKATESLKGVSEELLKPVLLSLGKSLPSGMLVSSKLQFRDDLRESAINWIVDQINIRLTTGDHDNTGVAPTDVGAGLQSVLDIAVVSVIHEESDIELFIAIEEPEAFLHPSLQRTIARTLLSADYANKILISTHSPILVEESQYEDILIAVDRKFHKPTSPIEPNRSAIHTALLNGQGAEMVFATSVLLVEGEGDRSFFEGLRRRLAEKDQSGRVDFLFVIQTGGSSNFAPWIKLLRDLSGNGASDTPHYLIAPDGDATQKAQRAFNDCNMSIPKPAIDHMQSCRQGFSGDDYEAVSD
tara:strand:+ start:341 stop:1510 length:1170 start_codon:yes stop_codon:yes gene_type:complete